jgi:glycosyltransferase involved in cell wall biosynthesis
LDISFEPEILPMRVSVIISSYNQERYLQEAIESVIQQTARPHEIIIADDHSTLDGSVELIRSYVKRYPGWVHGIFQQENVGIPKNRNSALREVTGDHVAILDGDDRLLPNHVAKLAAALQEHPEAGCSYSNRYQVNARGGPVRLWKTALQPSGDVFAHLAAGRTGRLRSMLARYDLVKAAGCLDERFFHQDGFILTLRLARLTKFAYVPEPLMEKREHAGGTSKTISHGERIRCFEDVFAEILRLGGNLPQPELKQVKQVWFRKLLKLRILAALEEGHEWEALLYMIRGSARDPRNTRNLWRVFRGSFHGTGRHMRDKSAS